MGALLFCCASTFFHCCSQDIKHSFSWLKVREKFIFSFPLRESQECECVCVFVCVCVCKEGERQRERDREREREKERETGRERTNFQCSNRHSRNTTLGQWGKRFHRSTRRRQCVCVCVC